MSAHLHWRVRFLGSQGGVYIQLREIEFQDALGANLCFGGTASASSEYSGGYTFANAFDGSYATQWSTVANDWPCWLRYTFTSAVDVAQVLIRCSAAVSYSPRTAADVILEYSDDASTWVRLGDSLITTDGGIFGADADITLRPFLLSSLQFRLVGGAGSVAGRPAALYSGVQPVGLLWVNSPNWRYTPPARATVLDNARVLFKASPETPEQPMPGARVRLHHLRTGVCAWQGTSDAQGYYYPYNLQVGHSYVPVAIDLQGNFECVAAGPVVAVEPHP